MKTKSSGFTLIELLVVIAIIGILSSVVLASLSTARNKGADAAIKSDIVNARAQAELYYSNNGQSYANLCTAPGGIGTLWAGIASSGGTATGNCASTATTWYLWSVLKAPLTTSYFCTDQTGTSTTKETVPSGGQC